MGLRILYLGDREPHTTSYHRFTALRRLGHDVELYCPRSRIPSHAAIAAFNVRTGFRLFTSAVRRGLQAFLGDRRFDLVWVDGCPELGASAYAFLRERCGKVVNYVTDDPYGGRDRRKWDLYLRCVPLHDLTVVMREVNVPEARSRGARAVLRVPFSYDPVAHDPAQAAGGEVPDDLRSEVVFVGTWMPERGPFFARLARLGVPVSIWGNRWDRAPEIDQFRSFLRGPAVYGGRYVAALRGAKVALGLLSKGNRDLHTQRSVEVPYIGVAFCAERTAEHATMYGEAGALLFDTPEQCADACTALLSDPARRAALIAEAASRLGEHFLSNDEVARRILGHPALVR